MNHIAQRTLLFYREHRGLRVGIAVFVVAAVVGIHLQPATSRKKEKYGWGEEEEGSTWASIAI